MDTKRQDLDMYQDFATFFIAPVIGKRTFDKTSFKYLFLRYVSVSDEAFALMVFENNYERWIDMAIKNIWAKLDVLPLYTTGGNTAQTPSKFHTNITRLNTSSTCVYQGRSAKGIKCYNDLYKSISREHETEMGKTFDDGFLVLMQEKTEGFM